MSIESSNPVIKKILQALANIHVRKIDKPVANANDYLVYNGVEWIGRANSNIPNPTTKQSNQVLLYNGSAWIASDPVSPKDSVIIYRNPTVTWESDSTYADYAYKGTVHCPLCTESHFPYVVFDSISVDKGLVASVSYSDTGCVYVWSKSEDVTVETIMLTKATTLA